MQPPVQGAILIMRQSRQAMIVAWPVAWPVGWPVAWPVAWPIAWPVAWPDFHVS